MLRTWWLQLLERKKHLVSEVIDVQMDLARENPKPSPNVFPGRPNRTAIVIVFWVILVLVASGCWLLIRVGGGHPY